MFSRVVQGITEDEVASRSGELNVLAEHLSERAVFLGLMGENCRTVCEEQLVVENGQLQRKVVCRIICTP